MIAAAGDKTVVFAKTETRADVIQQSLRHMLVVDHAHRIGLAPLFEAERHLVDQRLVNAGIDGQFGVPGKLEAKRVGLLDGNYPAEHLRQAGADNIVQDDKHLALLALAPGDLDEALQPIGGHLYHRIVVLVT